MLIEDIRNEVIVRAGQWILDADKLEIDSARFKLLINSCLRDYNRYSPFHDKINLTISNLDHTFTTFIDPPGIPDWIPDVLPIRSSGGFGIFQQVVTSQADLASSQTGQGRIVKRQFVFEYRKPVLYVPFGGDYDILYVRNHAIVNAEDGGDGKDRIPTLNDKDNDASFFDLLTGRFLVSLGRFRRAFTIAEAPVTFDAAELVSDGNEMVTNALEDIRENQNKFFLAWGG